MDLVHFDESKRIEDIEGLWWPVTDHGSWDGPEMDWRTNHVHKILGACDRMRVAVQAGGNMGLYPKLLARRFDWVYTFEPFPLSFVCLSRNVTEDNVFKVNAALSDRHGLVSIPMEHHENYGMNSVAFEVPGRIPSFRIDDLALDECDLIWLDTESTENTIIEGAWETIERFKPVIATENLSGPVLRRLVEMGYVDVDRSQSDTVRKYLPVV